MFARDGGSGGDWAIYISIKETVCLSLEADCDSVPGYFFAVPKAPVSVDDVCVCVCVPPHRPAMPRFLVLIPKLRPFSRISVAFFFWHRRKVSAACTKLNAHDLVLLKAVHWFSE